MSKKETREILERAMGPMMDWAALGVASREDLINALAEQAIVVPVYNSQIAGVTRISIAGVGEMVILDGLHGTPGKAIAIIVPEEKNVRLCP